MLMEIGGNNARPFNHLHDSRINDWFYYWTVKYKEIIMSADKLKLAYIASFVDGDGCIGLSQRQNKNRYYPYLRIANTNIKILKYIQKFYGFGSIQTANTTYRTTPNCKQCYYYQTVNQKATKIISSILPYLVLKQNQAKLIVKFQSKVKNYGYWNKNSKLFAWQENYYKKIRKLNKKGIN